MKIGIADFPYETLLAIQQTSNLTESSWYYLCYVRPLTTQPHFCETVRSTVMEITS